MYRGMNSYTRKRGCQPRSKLVEDENGDLLADSHNILNRWKNYYYQMKIVFRRKLKGDLILVMHAIIQSRTLHHLVCYLET
jgi:hypothetical protein